MKEYKIKTNLGKEIVATLTDNELIYGVTGILISTNSNYYIKCNDGKIKNDYALHPITNEKIDIVAVNDDTLKNFARLLVPAHNQDDYELAKKYDLNIKQVVAPYFLGTDDETPREDVETQFRRSIIAVVKDPKTEKYLCVDAKKRLCKSFVLGGIEEGETPEEAMKREVEEETGYNDVKVIDVSNFVLHNHFYAGYKGVNRYAHLYIVYGELQSYNKTKLSYEENEKQSTLWLDKNELKNFLTVNNNIFVYDEYLENEHAYEGDGIMMNSNELNGKMRSEAAKYGQM